MCLGLKINDFNVFKELIRFSILHQRSPTLLSKSPINGTALCNFSAYDPLAHHSYALTKNVACLLHVNSEDTR